MAMENDDIGFALFTCGLLTILTAFLIAGIYAAEPWRTIPLVVEDIVTTANDWPYGTVKVVGAVGMVLLYLGCSLMMTTDDFTDDRARYE